MGTVPGRSLYTGSEEYFSFSLDPPSRVSGSEAERAHWGLIWDTLNSCGTLLHAQAPLVCLVSLLCTSKCFPTFTSNQEPCISKWSIFFELGTCLFYCYQYVKYSGENYPRRWHDWCWGYEAQRVKEGEKAITPHSSTSLRHNCLVEQLMLPSKYHSRKLFVTDWILSLAVSALEMMRNFAVKQVLKNFISSSKQTSLWKNCSLTSKMKGKNFLDIEYHFLSNTLLWFQNYFFFENVKYNFKVFSLF